MPASTRKLHPHIYCLHMRHRLAANALWHGKQGQLPAASPRIGFKCRCCTSKKQKRTMLTCQDLRDHTCMIARRFILFIGHILLLIQDDTANVLCRHKECRPRSDNDSCLLPADTKYCIIAFCKRQPAVHNDNILRKNRLERRDELSRQSDFRYENNHLTPRCTNHTRCLYINARFPAACNTPKQISPITALYKARIKDSSRMRLIRGQRHFVHSFCLFLHAIAVSYFSMQMQNNIACHKQVFDCMCRYPLFCECFL